MQSGQSKRSAEEESNSSTVFSAHQTSKKSHHSRSEAERASTDRIPSSMQGGGLMAFAPNPLTFQSNGLGSPDQQPHQSLPSFKSYFGSVDRPQPPPTRHSDSQPRSTSSSPAIHHYPSSYGGHTRSISSVDAPYPVYRPDPARPHTPGQFYPHMRPGLAGHARHLSRRTSDTYLPNSSHSDHHLQPQVSTPQPVDVLSRGSPSSAGDRNDRSSRASSSTSGPPQDKSYFARSIYHGKPHEFVHNDATRAAFETNGTHIHSDMGVTKQNKPRKRQAQACKHCREKKVKCDFDPNRQQPCHACAKNGRTCEWASGTRLSPESGSKSDTGGVKRRFTSVEDGHASRAGYQSASPASSSGPLPLKADVDAERDSKRAKSPPQAPPQTSSRQSLGSLNASFLSGATTTTSSSRGHKVPADPYRLDPDATTSLLRYYFRYRDRGCGQVLPKATFLKWVCGPRAKTVEEVMVLNACLAVGAIYAPEARLRSFGQNALEVASGLESARQHVFSLLLAQTRLHISLCHWAAGEIERFLSCNRAASTALAVLRYNTEAGCASGVSPDSAKNEFGLSAIELIECRRRTFWFGYLSDRWHGYYAGYSGVFPDADVFVNVPNREDDYEAGRDTVGVPFAEGKFAADGCGDMALLIGVVSIWGEVSSEVYRSISRQPLDYSAHYEEYYARVRGRLATWEASLPPHLKISAENTTASIADGYFSTYYLLQAVLQVTSMRLNRYCNFAHMPPDHVRRNIGAARHHALAFLVDIVKVVSKLDMASYRAADVANGLLQAFSSHAIIEAVDILSCGGPVDKLNDIHSLVGVAGNVVDELAAFFQGGVASKALIRNRMTDFGAHKMIASRNGKPWKFKEPLQAPCAPLEHDALYGAPDDIFHAAPFESVAP